MKYAEVNNREINIIVEKAQRSDKVVVWGSFHKIGKSGKSFQRYFETVEKAMKYYNKQLDKATAVYLAKCEMIFNKYQ